jgi:type II secretory pathway component PulF
MELLAGVLGSRQAQLEMQGMMVRVRDYGSSFGSEVADMKWMPKFCGPLILVAEEAGRLPEMLNRLAGQLEEEIDLLVMRALSFLEPIMLAVMGVAVGFVLWSVFVPIYKLVEQL